MRRRSSLRADGAAGAGCSAARHEENRSHQHTRTMCEIMEKHPIDPMAHPFGAQCARARARARTRADTCARRCGSPFSLEPFRRRAPGPACAPGGRRPAPTHASRRFNGWAPRADCGAEPVALNPRKSHERMAPSGAAERARPFYRTPAALHIPLAPRAPARLSTLPTNGSWPCLQRGGPRRPPCYTCHLCPTDDQPPGSQRHARVAAMRLRDLASRPTV